MDNNNGKAAQLMSSFNEKRKFSIRSQVSCKEEENKTIPFGQYNGEFVIKKLSTKKKVLHLSISGENLITIDRKNLKSGVIMLPVIQITITQNIGIYHFYTV